MASACTFLRIAVMSSKALVLVEVLVLIVGSPNEKHLSLLRINAYYGRARDLLRKVNAR